MSFSKSIETLSSFSRKGDGAELIWDKVCVKNVWQLLVYQMCVSVLELYQNLVTMLGYCFISTRF